MKQSFANINIYIYIYVFIKAVENYVPINTFSFIIPLNIFFKLNFKN